VIFDPATMSPKDRPQRSRPLLRTLLGEVLRRARQEQGRTLADVARVARVSMPYLSELERGRKEASSEVLAAICEALRIDLSDVLAAVRRDLIAGHGRRPAVIRLDAVRGEQVPSPAEGPSAVLRGSASTLGGLRHGSGDVLALAA
jgi:transcriptional regulator with XRE-family HTH domain